MSVHFYVKQGTEMDLINFTIPANYTPIPMDEHINTQFKNA